MLLGWQVTVSVQVWLCILEVSRTDVPGISLNVTPLTSLPLQFRYVFSRCTTFFPPSLSLLAPLVDGIHRCQLCWSLPLLAASKTASTIIHMVHLPLF